MQGRRAKVFAVVGVVAGAVAACQTTQTQPTAVPQTAGSEWRTIPRGESLVQFSGEPRQDVIFTEVMGDGAKWRQERVYLLTDTYSGYRSRILATIVRKPVDPAFAKSVFDPDELENKARRSRCTDSELGPVTQATNANGPFVYLTCRRERGYHCVLAMQEIPDIALASGREHYTAMVEWLLCSATTREAENLARFATLRIGEAGETTASQTAPQTTPQKIPEDSEWRRYISWRPMIEAQSKFSLVGPHKPRISSMWTRPYKGQVRLEHVFLTSDSTAASSQFRVSFASKGFGEGPSQDHLSPEQLTNSAAKLCQGGEIGVVAETANNNGAVVYLPCRFPAGDLCILARQGIRKSEIEGPNPDYFVMMDFLYCSASETQAQILERFASLRVKGVNP